MVRTRAAFASFAAGVGLVLPLAACSAGPEPPASPWAAQLDGLRQHITNPEMLAALDDDVITDEELARGKQVALDCFAGRGVDASYDKDDRLTVNHPAGATQSEIDAAVSECGDYNYDLLKAFKEQMAYNPRNVPREQLLIDCFKRMRLVADSMTVDEFVAIDRDNPPWGLLSGDADGCQEDPINYRGGRPDLSPEDAGVGTDIGG